MSKQQEWLLHSRKIKQNNQIGFKVSIQYASHLKRKPVFVRQKSESLPPLQPAASKSEGTLRILGLLGGLTPHGLVH